MLPAPAVLVKMPSGYLLSLAFLYFACYLLLFILDITPRPSSMLKMNFHLGSHCMPKMVHLLYLLSMTKYLKRETDEGIKTHRDEVICPRCTASNC